MKTRIRPRTTLMSVTNAKRLYFEWLCRFVIVRGSPYEDTVPFLYDLHSKDFRWSVENDSNRAADGMNLRESYRRTTTEDCDCLKGPCSIFEMLIALSERMNFELGDVNPENRIPEFFWKLIRNLGLETYGECDPAMDKKRFLNDGHISRFLDREYHRSGMGGLFPLRRPHEDQRQIEIWYQMHAYLAENYTI